MRRANYAFYLLSIVAVAACQNQETVSTKPLVLELPATPYNYFVGAFDSASLNNNIPTLGRVLFYDSRLSINNSISCSSCHKQAHAFADNVAFSTGFEGKTTFRNSMPIQNLVRAFNGPTFFEGDVVGVGGGFAPESPLSLFWDGREKVLKAMVLRPITNHVEMGITDLDGLAEKLAALPEYQSLFTKAYGDPGVTQMKIAEALSQFLSAIVSNNSTFDKTVSFISSQPPVPLTALEQVGHDLFFGKYDCNSCHQTELLNGYQQGGGSDSVQGFINIGLDKNYKDVGVADVTGNASDVGKFKIPTLRNVALTAPYMHDGRFKTLDEVVDHYSEGIQDHPNLDPRLRTADNTPKKMDISFHDKQAIIAFLNTLTDFGMITDPRFSNPFRAK